MTVIDEHLGIMLAAFAAAFVAQMLLLRRNINSIADPLFFFALTTSFSLGLAIYAVDTVGLYLRIVMYFLCFYIGLLIALRRQQPPPAPMVLNQDISQFRAIVVLGCVIFFSVNIVMWAQGGLIIFSDDPSLQKSEAYSGGLGFIRRINWGLGIFVLMAAAFWWLLERSFAALICFLVAALISIAGGGKGALLPLVFALGLYFLRPFKPNRRKTKIIGRKALYATLILGVVPVVLVLLMEHNSLEAARDALLVRLFFFGDIILYWGQPELRAYFSTMGPLDYLRDSFGSILGVLRITDYATPIGNQFVQYSLPFGQDFSESLGPNLPFYVRGELFFGPWFAPFHAMAVGWTLGRIRLIFINYRGNSPLRYSLGALAVCLANSLPAEEGLAISQTIDFLFVFGIVYAIVSLMVSISSKPRHGIVHPI